MTLYPSLPINRMGRAAAAGSTLALCAIATTGCGDADGLEEIAVATQSLVSPTVYVRAVFLVPRDKRTPSAATRERLMDHLTMAQSEYRTMLKDRDTFTLSSTTPLVLRDSTRTAADYQTEAETNPGVFLERPFAVYGVDRITNPYVFVIVPVGVGGGTWAMPINGGVNGGGGVVVLTAGSFDAVNLQSTLQHELGHAFGMLHSYDSNYSGYHGVSSPPNPPPENLAEPPECAATLDPCPAHSPPQCRFSAMQGWTIMSQNVCHHTQDLTASATPGELLPEDINRLALNDHVFPKLYYDPEVDVDSSYVVQQPLWFYPPLTMEGQPSATPTVWTGFGELGGSHVFNVVGYTIRKSNGETPFDPVTMWHSSMVNEAGWASLTVDFPEAVPLDEVEVHTQHSG